MGKWRQKARKIISEALAEAKAQGVKFRELRRFIGQRYDVYIKSFQEDPGKPALRKKYPYRVWCDELNDVLESEKLGAQQMRLTLEPRS